MRSEEHLTEEKIIPHQRRLKLELFYFEQIGSRSYLRITRLGLILILLFTVLPVIVILSLFLINRSTPTPDVDIIIKPRQAENTSTYPTIKQPSPPPTPKAVRQPTLKQTSPPVLATTPDNGNTQ